MRHHRTILRSVAPTVKTYISVTETPGIGASQEQLEMLYTRYHYAAQYCEDKDVLEVACGAGQGLGYLATGAKTVVGGDYTEASLTHAYRHYAATLPLLRFDARHLPFRSASFDVVIIYEALYYFEDPGRCLNECRRVLRTDGVLIVCTVNKEWPDFNPSPMSTQYFSACELEALLAKSQFDTELRAAFPVATRTVSSRLKRLAVKCHLMPKTMKGKQLLKRVFFGPLSPLPPEVHDGMAPYHPPVKILSTSPVPHFKVLYAVARPQPQPQQ